MKKQRNSPNHITSQVTRFSRNSEIKLASNVYILILVLFVIFISLSGASASSVNTPASLNIDNSNLNNSSLSPAINPEELEAFMDGAMNSQLKAHNIPGATVSVVKDGRIIFAKGYGYADLDKRSPVVANQTLFRVGSVSKLFVWTAVMQLSEQGKLDLDADVNTYLKDFQIPAAYPRPVALRELMSHTAGFEDLAIGGRTFVRNSNDVKPLGEYLETKMPSRVRPAGEFTAYSNYGSVLAAYIVEQVSGMPFDEYVEKNILLPLEMKNTTFNQPLPSRLASNMSNGYVYSNNAYTSKPFEYLQTWPAGSMSSTSEDMAKFMIAHLQNGKYGDTRILQEETAQKMHSRLFTNDPRVNGMAYGFWEINPESPRIIGHGGDTILFHTQLILVPDCKLGFFISCNEQNSEPAVNELVQTFKEHYYPVPVSSASKFPSSFKENEANASLFAGGYRPTRSAYTNFEKLASLFQEIQVSSGPNNTLTTFQLTQGSKNWVEVEPQIFSPASGQPSEERLVFSRSPGSEVTHLFMKLNPTTAYEKVPWNDDIKLNFPLLGICILFFLSTLIWPIGVIFNRCPMKSRKPASIARWFAGGASIINLLFFTGLISLFLTNPADAEFIYSISSFLILLLTGALTGALLALGSAVFMVFAWRDNYWGFLGRTHYTLVVFSLLAFIWWLNNWNLLGFRFLFSCM
ncbi:MAG: serine hydrolase [Methanosarcina sp.]